jgi:hypothetical protein
MVVEARTASCAEAAAACSAGLGRELAEARLIFGELFLVPALLCLDHPTAEYVNLNARLDTIVLC